MNLTKMLALSFAPVLYVATGFLLGSCVEKAVAQTVPVPDVVASAGNVTISQSDVERLLKGMTGAERTALKANPALLDQWLRQRLATEALLDEARRKAWAERPEVKASVDAAMAEVTQRIVLSSYLESLAPLPAAFPSDADLAAAYAQGMANFGLPASYRIAQIYLAAPSSDAAALSKLRDEAQKLALQARSGDFAELARRRSDDARSAARGGEVGVLPLAQLLPEVRTPVSQLKLGEVTDALPTSTGYHIVKLMEIVPPRVATLEEMKPQLQAALRQQRQQQLVQEHMAALVPAASVRIDNAARDRALDAALQKMQ
jgi:peptidylprolyl isomerase